MNLLKTLPFISSQIPAPLQLISTSWSERSRVLEKGVNLYCWKREVNYGISEYLEQCLQHELPNISFFTQEEDLASKLRENRASWDHHHGVSGDLFWEDVYHLTKDFLGLSSNKSGTLFLKVIDNNACTKFHTDGDSLRMFVTYYGKGTEWLPEKAVNRKGLGKRNQLIVKDPEQIQHLKTFDVGILKGQVPGSNAKGIVHRSPEIKSAGEKRIILRVDI